MRRSDKNLNDELYIDVHWRAVLQEPEHDTPCSRAFLSVPGHLEDCQRLQPPARNDIDARTPDDAHALRTRTESVAWVCTRRVLVAVAVYMVWVSVSVKREM
ncbi:hypothetical protein BV22DRAFT_1038450 [Leucogyrophana mollusca]|uniref:Uncharacterized protein n=1 Tax=Leucogyrophana mollusca TaxID=85980 RepID=A0ACB8B8U1_9AGAM|nr:hypothetical protein BV22DRAFT_1038450 [Leucogyrophana mollusca]